MYLENNWNWEEKYPVVRVSFDTTFSKREELEEFIVSIQEKYAKEFEVKLNSKHVGLRNINLIEGIYQKTGRKVVLLIDEYGKPILDNIEKREIAEEIREVLE